jgi:hypothetical protein
VATVRRAAGLLPAGSRPTVREPTPLCAGSWQYTVITVAGREPLRVVTKGQPAALSLVTAGTNVCTVQVRAAAPVGIRTAAACY